MFQEFLYQNNFLQNGVGLKYRSHFVHFLHVSFVVDNNNIFKKG